MRNARLTGCRPACFRIESVECIARPIWYQHGDTILRRGRNFADGSRTTGRHHDRCPPKRRWSSHPISTTTCSGAEGLIAQLTADGAECGCPLSHRRFGRDRGDRRSRRVRRTAPPRRRPAALQILGVSDIEFLDLPDGSLSAPTSDEAAEAIRRALEARSPDLLLAISPLEISADHRAAFAATHAALSTVCGAAPISTLRSMVSRFCCTRSTTPHFRISWSMSPTRSTWCGGHRRPRQPARAPQLSGSDARPAFLRTASLSPDVKAAEGYRRSDRPGLRHPQPRRPGPPTRRRPRTARRRRRTVGQRRRAHQGPSASCSPRRSRAWRPAPTDGSRWCWSTTAASPRRSPMTSPSRWSRSTCRRISAAPRQPTPGSETASGEWIAFLDDDDLAEPEHLATLAGLSTAAGTRVVYTDAAVGVYELDPDIGWREVARRLPYSRDFDPDLLLFDNYIPFNTLLIERGLFDEVGAFDTSLPFFEDWDMLIRLAATHALPPPAAGHRRVPPLSRRRPHPRRTTHREGGLSRHEGPGHRQAPGSARARDHRPRRGRPARGSDRSC